MRYDEMTHEDQPSDLARTEAEKLRHGKFREALVRRARQLETARQINQWRLSPEHKQSE